MNGWYNKRTHSAIQESCKSFEMDFQDFKNLFGEIVTYICGSVVDVKNDVKLVHTVHKLA